MCVMCDVYMCRCSLIWKLYHFSRTIYQSFRMFWLACWGNRMVRYWCVLIRCALTGVCSRAHSGSGVKKHFNSIWSKWWIRETGHVESFVWHIDERKEVHFLFSGSGDCGTYCLFLRSRNVSGDTELFQKGALGKTPDGCVFLLCTQVPILSSNIAWFLPTFSFSSHITTYKELCSLASDLNQPDLVYKFMHLANHHALWNSKKVGTAAPSSCWADQCSTVGSGLWFLFYCVQCQNPVGTIPAAPHPQAVPLQIWSKCTCPTCNGHYLECFDCW